MNSSPSVGRRFWLLYPAWTLLCVVLFVSLRGAEDPSRRDGRMLSDVAGERAITLLRARDSAAYGSFTVSHVAYSSRGELGPEPRWIVLCEQPSSPGLSDAVVVELDARDGRLLRLRKPGHLSDSVAASVPASSSTGADRSLK